MSESELLSNADELAATIRKLRKVEAELESMKVDNARLNVHIYHLESRYGLLLEDFQRVRKELDNRINMCDMRSEKILELTNERDEARRMYCKAVADHYEYACNAELDGAGPYTQKDVAKDEGWDCFKEDGK
jgi:chromosome segregation ATPase